MGDARKSSQSLFYWNPFCNKIYLFIQKLGITRRNPYFIGILSAINESNQLELCRKRRNPYFIGILSAIPCS